ncbi:MAG: acyl-CoA dehydrogenase family protein, partial [Methanobacteriota archaeon]
MDFALSPEQELLRRSVREFADKEIRPVAADVDRTGVFPKDTVARMARLGLLGVTIPSEYGGAGLDA